MKYMSILVFILHYIKAILGKCKHFRGKVYGYEFGWRRKDLNGTNLVTRIYFGKPI